MDLINKIEYLYKLVIFQHIQIRKNMKKIRYYDAKKNILLNEIAEYTTYIPDEYELPISLVRLSLTVNKLEDELVLMLLKNKDMLEYMR